MYAWHIKIRGVLLNVWGPATFPSGYPILHGKTGNTFLSGCNTSGDIIPAGRSLRCGNNPYQEHIHSARNPDLIGHGLAHGTGTVATGIVMIYHMSAFFAVGYIRPKSTCFAVHDVIGCFPLSGRRMMTFGIAVPESPEDILYGWLIHTRHLLPGKYQKDSGFPWGLLKSSADKHR